MTAPTDLPVSGKATHQGAEQSVHPQHIDAASPAHSVPGAAPDSLMRHGDDTHESGATACKSDASGAPSWRVTDAESARRRSIYVHRPCCHSTVRGRAPADHTMREGYSQTRTGCVDS